MTIDQQEDLERVRAELTALFTEAQAARTAFLAAIADHRQFTALPEPVRPTEVIDLDDWMRYTAARRAYAEALKASKAARDDAEDRWKRIERTIISRLPKKVWFKFGDFGMGVAEGNWGDNKTYVVIEPWQSPMQSLDRRHMGD